jgi:hypothetical protein
MPRRVPQVEILDANVSPSKRTRPSRIKVRTIATVSRGATERLPIGNAVLGLYLDLVARTKNRPPDKSATEEAAIAIVGAVRTKTLLILVPSRMREVRIAQAARIANWSPPWPSAIHAGRSPSSANTMRSTISTGLGPPENAMPIFPT